MPSLESQPTLVAHTLFCILSLVSFAACSGSDDSSSTQGYRSGLPRDKVLSEVTQAEAEAACSARQQEGNPLSIEEFKRLRCGLQAQTIAGAATSQGQAQMTCQQSFNTCLALPDSTFDRTLRCDGWFDEFQGCSAKVSDYDTCLTDQFASYRAFGQNFSCSASAVDPTMPPSCQALKAKCPSLH